MTYSLPNDVYEIKFQANQQIAAAVLLSLQQAGVTLPDFLEGIGMLLSEQEHTRKAAMHVDRATHYLHQHEIQIKE